MKLTFLLSAQISASLGKTHDTARIVQACEAERNKAKCVKDTSSGTRNEKKSSLAKTGVALEYEQAVSKVTAFMQLAESEVGTYDRTLAKLEKLGGSSCVFSLESMPATYKTQDIAGWLKSFENGKPSKVAKPAKTPEPVAPVAPPVVPAVA